eukprot:5911029-Prorocentrum_lima.AAC.1
MVKEGLRTTSLARYTAGAQHLGGRRVQGMAHATRAMPVLQAIVNSESCPNITGIFESLQTLWAQ